MGNPNATGDVVILESVKEAIYDFKVTSIDQYAFYRSSVTSVTLPNTITTIGPSAFFAVSTLEKVVLGSGLTSIGSNAFAYCEELTAVECNAEVPPTIAEDTFPEDVKANITLTVPAGKAAIYKAAPNWSGFKEYVEPYDPNVGVNTIATSFDAPARWFNLQGVEIATPEKGQILIEFKDGKSRKVIF